MRLAALLLSLLMTASAQAQDLLRIAVASNFRATLEQVNREFKRDTKVRISLSSASTGVLATQIYHGAPFDLFFAADRKTPADIANKNESQSSECYAVGKLALIGGNGSLDQLASPALSLAIANPATAPYGRAAQEVLARAAFAAGSKRKLIRGNNVVQAYQFWISGGVDLALLAQSIAPAGSTPVPSEWHTPVEQHVVILRPSAAADKYLKWLRSDRVRSIITSAGYDPCP